MLVLRWSRAILSASFVALLAGCAGTARLPARQAAAAGPAPQAFEFAPRMPRKGVAQLVFLNGTTSGNVYAYDASTGARAAVCKGCGGGAGLATNAKTGDIAIGAGNGTVTVWHVAASQLTKFATLTMSSGYYCIGIAFDSTGNLYVVDDPAFNTIDVFSAATIAAGGGPPETTFFPTNVDSVNFLLGDGRGVLMSGFQGSGSIGARLITRGKRASTARIFNAFGSSGAGGFALDPARNLIASDGSDTLSVYAKPWTGTPASTYALGFQAQGIALDASGKRLWVTAFHPGPHGTYTSNAVALNYPNLGDGGVRTPEVVDYFLDVTLSPAK